MEYDRLADRFRTNTPLGGWFNQRSRRFTLGSSEIGMCLKNILRFGQMLIRICINIYIYTPSGYLTWPWKMAHL